MRRRRKVSFFARYKAAIIWGVILILAGVICIAIAYNRGVNDDFEMKTFNAETEIHTLRIDSCAGEVNTEFYDGDRIFVEYPENARFTVDITENDGVLSITSENKWYASFINLGFLFSTPVTTVKIPADNVLNLDCSISAGDFNLAAGSYSKVEIDVSAGDFNAGDIGCDSLRCKISAGNINLKNVSTGDMEYKVSAGGIHTDSVVCDKFNCKISAGNINMGKLDCPDSDIKISAGGVNIEFADYEQNYTIFVDKSAGNCNVSDRASDTGKKISIDISAGNAECKFKKD